MENKVLLQDPLRDAGCRYSLVQLRAFVDDVNKAIEAGETRQPDLDTMNALSALQPDQLVNWSKRYERSNTQMEDAYLTAFLQGVAAAEQSDYDKAMEYFNAQTDINNHRYLKNLLQNGARQMMQAGHINYTHCFD